MKCERARNKVVLRAVYRTISILAASCLILWFSSCSSSSSQKMPFALSQAVPVSVATVLVKDVPVQIKVIGTVVAYSTVSIKSMVNGEIVKVNFTEGHEVRKGAPLFEIDSRPFQADLRRNQANLAKDTAQLQQAKANLARDTAQAQNAAVESRRYEQLVAKGVAAKQQYDQYRTNAEALEAAVRADQAAIENANEAIRADNAALDNSKIQLGYCTIYSPIEGRTGSLIVHQGNVVKSNDIAMVVINQVIPIYVNFAVPEQYLPEIRRYMALGKVKVEAIPADATEPPSQGVLTFIDNAVDSTTGTIKLKATYVNSDRRLWPGQFVNVVVTLASQPNAIVVPNEAVQSGQQGPYVFVVKPDLTAESRLVTPGRVIGGETVIEKGLQPGEKVVTDGQLRLVPGAKVQIKEPVEVKQGS